MKNKFIAICIIVLVSASIAQAQTEKGKSEPSGKNVKSKTTLYDFEEVDILGNLKRPEGQSITEPPEFRFRRLLDLDESFIPQIIRSVDEF